MSKYGDERMHMEEWQDQLQERAKVVGPAKALQEFHQVAVDFCDTYWTEKDEPKSQYPELTEAPVGPSSDLTDACLKGLGLPPYNTPTNFLVGDGYYWASVRNKYGATEVTRECDRLRRAHAHGN